MASDLTITSTYRMNSGYHIPVLGYGVYKSPKEICNTIVQQAVKAGYRHVDSAAGYYNEAECAEGLLNSGIPREQLFFTSKVNPGKINYADAKKIIDATIKNINVPGTQGLKYVDLMLLHAPFGGKENRLGAWQALVEGVEEGKIRSIGVSNYGVKHLDELENWMKKTEAEKGKGKGGVLSVNQVELHPWLARPDLDEWCSKRGVLLEAFSPLARSYRLEEPVLAEMGKKYGKTPAQVLIRWSLQKGSVPLPKSVTHERIIENADVYDFKLSEDDMGKLHTGVYEPSEPNWDPTTAE
ncbi:MAG: hypothetical protein Q9159_005221 [Coniocarpon cinnabarinum]